MSGARNESATVDRLRADIDGGRTGDKVSFPDPAMSPLGTDDEAAGTPPSREAIAQAQKAETQRVTSESAAVHRPLHFSVTTISLALLVVVVCAAAAYAMFAGW